MKDIINTAKFIFEPKFSEISRAGGITLFRQVSDDAKVSVQDYKVLPGQQSVSFVS